MEVVRRLHSDPQKEKRLDRIFTQLKKGANAHEIAEQLGPRRIIYQKKLHNADEVGEASERRVFGLLLSHPLVKDLQIGENKPRGIEGFIVLDDAFPRHIIPFQVKSSPKGEERFMREQYDWVVEHYGEPVLLNGGPATEDEEILDSFEGQMKGMGIISQDYNRNA